MFRGEHADVPLLDQPVHGAVPGAFARDVAGHTALTGGVDGTRISCVRRDRSSRRTAAGPAAAGVRKGGVPAHVAARVAPYGKVRRVELTDAAPRAAGGRIPRRELRAGEKTGEKAPGGQPEERSTTR